MKIARPPGGFKVTLAPNVALLVEQRCNSSATFERHWADILDRIRMLAHIEGVPHSSLGDCRLWISEADESRDLPQVKLIYSVLGANVRVLVAMIG